MKGLDGSRMHSRVKGKAALLKSLHQLHRRVYRFAACRDVTPQDYRWALNVATALQVLLHGEQNGRRAS